MKRQIRNNIFETNSSSTHAICIPKNTDIKYLGFPTHMIFNRGTFGWEFEVYRDIETKASYLFEAIMYYGDDNTGNIIEQIRSTLSKYGITCEFNFSGQGYIDHGGDTCDFVRAVLADEKKLLAYLFGDGVVITGNDNDDLSYDYMYDEYRYDDEGNILFKREFDDYEIFEKGN